MGFFGRVKAGLAAVKTRRNAAKNASKRPVDKWIRSPEKIAGAISD
jgi:hypothetical protein